MSIRSAARKAATLACLPLLCSCFSPCPEPRARPTPATYEVTSSPDAALVGATVTVTEDEIVLEYTRDGVPVKVTWEVGERLD
ncbi:hypothetical protein L6R53_32915 [Myxococcota bacterium]|nr:hypothetical protein [Myxococcota bacterium]